MTTNNFVKGIGIGTAIGLTVGMLISPRDSHQNRTPVARAVRTFANIIDTVANTITT